MKQRAPIFVNGKTAWSTWDEFAHDHMAHTGKDIPLYYEFETVYKYKKQKLTLA
jgi:hypothetical protein